MERQHPKRVEGYTNANLILIFVNLLWIFGVIWANFGIVAVILTGWALNLGITKLKQVKDSREIQWPSRS